MCLINGLKHGNTKYNCDTKIELSREHMLSPLELIISFG